MLGRIGEFVVAGDGEFDVDALRSRLTLAEGARRRVRRTWLDTVDWRLDRAGATLEQVMTPGAGSKTVLRLTDREPFHLVGPVSWPGFVDALPPGPLRQWLAPVVEMRALLPVVRVAGTVREFRVLDPEAKTVARLVIEQLALADRPGTALRPRLRIVPVRGYDKYAARVARELASAGAESGADSQLAEALAAIGRRSRDYTGKVDVPMDREQPAAISVAAVLSGVLSVIEANVDGVVSDVDTEFLHDLRVGVRRTRSALKLAGDVLPDDLAARYAPEFKWLGDLTTPTRDLDVYLLGFTDLGGGLELPHVPELEPLRTHLAKRRRTEQRRLARSLRSERFGALLADWRRELTRVPSTISRRKDKGPTTAELAAARVGKAHRRVVKAGSAITPESPAEALHDLRKRCKELRYVLDLFGPVFDQAVYRRVIGDLKRLQDCLGVFQDTEVQHEAIRAFAAEMAETGSAPADTLLAMGELGARLDEHKVVARKDFADRFARFTRPKNAERIKQLTTVDSQ